MDREKTLEVLRGMKFMQRKEETRRREVLQAEQQQELRAQIDSPRGATMRGGKLERLGPTIIVDDTCSAALLATGRRNYGRAASGATSLPASSPLASSLGNHAAAGDPTDAVVEKPSASAVGVSKRFVVPESVRAPKLPAKLSRLVSQAAQQKKKRDREDEERDELNPLMRL